MKTIVVDDEPWMLKRFDIECRDIPDLQLVGSFRSPLRALDFVRENHIELAFLDVEMPEMNGIALAQKLRELQPRLIIIFVSAYDQYMSEAFRRQIADYYIMKPYDRKDMEAAVERARLLSGRLRKAVSIRTFGSFDVFVDGQPLAFADDKAKELLALLVQARGGVVSRSAACRALWPEPSEAAQPEALYRQAMQQLAATLCAARLEALLEQNAQGAFVHTEAFDCDLYRCLDGDLAALRQYGGVYLSGYAWADTESGRLAGLNGLLARYSDSLTRSSLCAGVHCRNDAALTLTYMNESFLALTGYERQELAEHCHNSLRALMSREDYKRLLQNAAPGVSLLADAEFRLLDKEGEEHWVLCKCEPGREAEESDCLLIDISGLKAEQQQLEQAAQRDALTGLLNRGAAQPRIERYLAEAVGSERCAALVLLDVDNFKAVNDSYGHPFADTVLTDIAAILSRAFRSSDIICRLGGDEMLIFLKDVGGREEAAAKLTEARQALAVRLRAKTAPGELSCSFGGAFFPTDGPDHATLYQRADQALYQAKQQKNTMVWFGVVQSAR